MSFLHAKCEKEIAELKTELEKSNKKCKDLSGKVSKKEGEIAELEADSIANDNNDLIESYKKVIENIASIITPTDYKIIEMISSLDDGLNNFIIDENLPEIQVKLEIEESNKQLTMSAINTFINRITIDLSALIQSIDLEQIETNGSQTILDFNVKYRNAFEFTTAKIVEFCQSHFLVTFRGSYGSTNYEHARKPIILKNSKKDHLLKLKMIPI